MKTEGTVYTQQSDNNRADFNLDSYDMAPAAATAKATGPTVAQIAGAGVGGLVIGAVAMTLMSGKSADDEITGIIDPDDDGTATYSREDLADGEIEFADSVDDDMSFSQAFAAARAEVGAGGAFVWHGSVYGTYTAGEWQSMSEAEREAYSSHFAWDNIEHDTRHDHEQQEQQPGEQEQQPGEQEPQPGEQDPQPGEQDPQPGEQEPQPGEQEPQPGEQGPQPGEQGPQPVPEGRIEDPEVEIVEIVRDDTSGYVALSVDGQEAYYVDVDGDGVIDAAIYDANGDGVIQEEEVVDVHEEGITLDDFSEASGIEIQDNREEPWDSDPALDIDDTLSEQDILDI